MGAERREGEEPTEERMASVTASLSSCASASGSAGVVGSSQHSALAIETVPAADDGVEQERHETPVQKKYVTCD